MPATITFTQLDERTRKTTLFGQSCCEGRVFQQPVNPPRVIDLISGEIVLDLWQTDWDADVGFPGPHQVLLRCRRYHAGGGLTVVLNLAEGTYQILNVQNVGGPLPTAPLNQIDQGMEEASQCSAAATPGRAAPDITTAPSWRNWAKVIATVVGVLTGCRKTRT